MDPLENLETKVRRAAELLLQYRSENETLRSQRDRLQKENEFLRSENAQVNRVLAELHRLRQERKLVREKSQKLLLHLSRLKVQGATHV